MKLLLPYVLFLSLFCFTSCEDEVPKLPCETLGEEITEFIRDNSFNRVRVDSPHLSFIRDAFPFVEGCTVSVDEDHFNLENLIHYSIVGSTFVMSFN